jgi:hypothetical protein
MNDVFTVPILDAMRKKNVRQVDLIEVCKDMQGVELNKSSLSLFLNGKANIHIKSLGAIIRTLELKLVQK